MRLKMFSLMFLIWPAAEVHAEPLLEVKAMVSSWPGESLLFRDLLEDNLGKFTLPQQLLSHTVFAGKEITSEATTYTSADISKRLRLALTSYPATGPGVQFRLPLEVEIRPEPYKFLESRMVSDLVQGLQTDCTCKVELSNFQLQWPEGTSAQASWKWESLPDVRFLRGNLFLGVDLKTGSQKHRRWVQARSRLLKRVPVATRAISYGEPFTSSNVGQEWRDISHVSQDVLQQLELAGHSSNRMIPMGQMVRRRDLVKSQVIKHGDVVRIHNQKGPLQVTAQGVAQQAGAIGDSIKVKISSTHKTVSALVEESGKVRMQ